MRKSLLVLISLAMAALFTAASVSAEGIKGIAENSASGVKATPVAMKRKTVSVTGEISEVDPAASTIKVKESNKEVILNVTDKTKITVGKTKKSLADLKVGEKLSAKAREEDSKLVARSIHTASVKKGAAKAEGSTIPQSSQ